MNNITTVDQLIEILDDADPLEQGKIMKRIKIEASGLESYLTWSDKCYTRNCLARTEKYEIILLCWEVGAKAPIHGHGGEECWVYQVQGTVEEMRYEEVGECLKPTNKMILTPGKLTYMNDKMGYHSIQNISSQRSMTLHIYACPIDACKVFNDDTDCFELKVLSYDTYRGNQVESVVS